MKRILSVLAVVALVAMTVQAAPVEVRSQNVAGVINITVPPGGLYTLAGLNLDGFGGAPTRTVEELFGTDQLRQNNLSTLSDRLHIYDSSIPGYISVFQKADGHFYNVQSPTVQTNPVISTGQAFWIQSANSAGSESTVSLVGQVVFDSTVDAVRPSDFDLISNPYAVPLDVNGTNVDWIADGAKANNLSTLADRMYIWDGSAYESLYLRADDSKWHEIQGNALATNGVIPVGGGAWYQAKGLFTNTVIRPYAAASDL